MSTRMNLHRRRIIEVGESTCVLCGDSIETAVHLLLYCEVALKVWKGVFHWLDLPFSLPHNMFSIIHCLIQVGGKVLRKGLCSIWQAVVWSLWRHGNAVLFERGISNHETVLEVVKVSTWKWWLNQSKSLQFVVPSSGLLYAVLLSGLLFVVSLVLAFLFWVSSCNVSVVALLVLAHYFFSYKV
ncbi:pentatricopeptide repeat-containing protein [Trifolium medium]|uniref:Pentatricopeptide repeat-containing protein n=1 Tax=Trifolium medium TaxID=97028 RepID=A0A392M2K0_9FABA|nr:pentatricopeptide repeat-containing protein [Trifolium medium]